MVHARDQAYDVRIVGHEDGGSLRGVFIVADVVGAHDAKATTHTVAPAVHVAIGSENARVDSPQGQPTEGLTSGILTGGALARRR